MTGDRDALLRAILAAPADDLPRLVFADWVEEHGDPERAAYIRAQVELSGLVRERQMDTDEYLALVRAVAGVPNELLWSWAATDGLPATPGGLVTRDTVGDLDRVRDVSADLTFGFRRGVVEAVRCRTAFWVGRGHQAVAVAPVNRVKLSDRRPLRFRQVEWVWRTVEGVGPGDFSNTLPLAVFDHLPDRQAFVAVYRTRGAALDALSAACLAYARTHDD